MPRSARSRVAIVLFNLGGPDRPEAIRPFLRNLFADPAVLRVPFFIRPFLARRIAAARLAPATANYALLGGRSPLLELTRTQAQALQAALPELDAKCFVAMRYWHPFSIETAREVKQWDPDETILLPLYPQFSTTTTGSSLTAWHDAAATVGLVAPVSTLCCYPNASAYAASIAALVQTTYETAARQHNGHVRLLFSAHGLPEIIVRSGDPYQWQVEQTVHAVLRAWGNDHPADWAICYQSRATPQKWLEPSTEQELERAARDGVAVVVVPIAFVSEHSETLVELDIEYRQFADRLGISGYFRVPAPNDDGPFIAALATLVQHARARGPGLCSHSGDRICPAAFTGCPMAARPDA
ncbi:MAG TPA: ferrochelatase [Acetobacteraceae bacterium]